MTRMSLYELFKQSSARKLDDKLSFVEKKVLEMTNCPEQSLNVIRRDLTHFRSDFKRFWISSKYFESTFVQRHDSWLKGSIAIHTWISSNKTGRPAKEFNELSDRSKRRRTEGIRKDVSTEELTYAASVSQRASGNVTASKMINEMTSTPTRAKKFKKIIDSSKENKITKLSVEKSLSLFIDGGFSRRQWELLHSTCKEVFPCYTIIRDAKKVCYPKPEYVRVTETSAEVELQGLLDHTTTRLCTYLSEVFDNFGQEELVNLELISKWGCDGSTQNSVQQKFSDGSYNDDSNIFQSSLLPLRLQSHVGDQIKVIWQNPTPSSPRFCRPIRIRFLHETADITKEEINYVETQYQRLTKTEVLSENGTIQVQHKLVMTMVDGKVCNAATDTKSTMRCYICGLTSKNFNNLKNKNVENPEALKFGLSVLHARIRLFESVLHLSYKLPIKKWQARSDEEKAAVLAKKKSIQKAYKERTGMLIDMPRQISGNTNAGNTSRRFFSDIDLASEITGIDKDFLKRIKIILEVISSGLSANITKFAEYCDDTAKLYVRLYNWHPMTPTLHKILVHGAAVIQHAILPIGQLSEEAAEARNQHYRTFRLQYARKFTRKSCNEDVLNRLLLTSDPYMSCNRKRKNIKSIPFSPEAIDLLALERDSLQMIS